MKVIILSMSLLTSIACSHTPMNSSGLNETEMDREATDASHPSPNTGYTRTTINDATQQDPEGDLAPMISCRRGEVERHMSGKIVCVNADRVDPNNSTVTGR